MLSKVKEKSLVRRLGEKVNVYQMKRVSPGNEIKGLAIV
jgi:hypothetical protein